MSVFTLHFICMSVTFYLYVRYILFVCALHFICMCVLVYFYTRVIIFLCVVCFMCVTFCCLGICPVSMWEMEKKCYESNGGLYEQKGKIFNELVG